MNDTITIGTDDGVQTITLNRPERLNAFNATMAQELVGAFEAADLDDVVRCIVVTGAGRAFCAGADLEAGADTFNYDVDGGGPRLRPDGAIDYTDPRIRDTGGLVALAIYRCRKPVIAAINGAAVGVGLTMTLPMDIRMVAQGAKLGFVFARRGIVPDGASSWFLPRVVGLSRALEWCATGRIFMPDEAREGGLVRSIHAPDELLGAAYAIAREIADNTSAVSVALTRQMLLRSYAQDHPMEAHRLDSAAVYARGRSADAAEGVQSFLEKRPARYPDKVSCDMPEIYPWWTEPEYN